LLKVEQFVFQRFVNIV